MNTQNKLDELGQAFARLRMQCYDGLFNPSQINNERNLLATTLQNNINKNVYKPLEQFAKDHPTVSADANNLRTELEQYHKDILEGKINPTVPVTDPNNPVNRWKMLEQKFNDVTQSINNLPPSPEKDKTIKEFDGIKEGLKKEVDQHANESGLMNLKQKAGIEDFKVQGPELPKPPATPGLAIDTPTQDDPFTGNIIDVSYKKNGKPHKITFDLVNGKPSFGSRNKYTTENIEAYITTVLEHRKKHDPAHLNDPVELPPFTEKNLSGMMDELNCARKAATNLGVAINLTPSIAKLREQAEKEAKTPEFIDSLQDILLKQGGEGALLFLLLFRLLNEILKDVGKKLGLDNNTLNLNKFNPFDDMFYKNGVIENRGLKNLDRTIKDFDATNAQIIQKQKSGLTPS